MPNKLVNLEVHEVSGVDRPANGTPFILMKAARHPGKSEGSMPGQAKPDGLIERTRELVKSLYGSMFGDAVEADPDFKPALDFNAALAEEQRERAEYERNDVLWQLNNALQCSVRSILDDPTVEDKRAAIVACLQQYLTALGDQGVLGGGVMAKAAEVMARLDGMPELTEKAGRAISGTRMAVLDKLRTALDDMMKELTDLVSGAKPKEKPKADPEADEEPGAGAAAGKKPDDRAKKAQEETVKDATTTTTPAATPTAVEKAGEAAPFQITKAEYEALTKQAQAATERAEAAEKVAKAEEDKRVTGEFVAKAAGMPKLPMAAAELGPLLKALHDKAPEETVKLLDVLKAANEQIEKGALFAEAGSAGGSSGGSAWEKVKSIAKARVEKGEFKTEADAIAKMATEKEHATLIAETRAS